MRMIHVLHSPPTNEELSKIISRVAKGKNLGYLWKNKNVIFGIIESASFPMFTQDSEWNTYLSNKFSLVVKPSARVGGTVVNIKMVVYVLDIHFVARELSTLSLQH